MGNRQLLAQKYVDTIEHKNSSGDEIANVNFYAVRAEAIPEFAEITQNNCHYAVQGRSKSFKVNDFGTN